MKAVLGFLEEFGFVKLDVDRERIRLIPSVVKFLAETETLDTEGPKLRETTSSSDMI